MISFVTNNYTNKSANGLCISCKYYKKINYVKQKREIARIAYEIFSVILCA